MRLTMPISTRWRVVGPITAGASLLPRAATLAGPTTPQNVARTGAAGPLPSLLALVPDSATDADDGSMALINYADLAAQLTAGGIEPPASIENAEAFSLWINAGYPLLLPEPFRSRADQVTRAAFGLEAVDIDQALEAGEQPETIILLRGRFDQEAVAAAWEVNGYEMLEVEGIRVASLVTEAAIDLASEVGRLAFVRMNNAAFLPDGTLVYTASLALMEAVIATANGEEASLAERDDVVTTLASVEDPLASAMLVPGAALSVSAQEESRGSQLPEATGNMPPIALGLIGMTPGGPTSNVSEPVVVMPPATIVYRLLMAEPGTAEEAAAIADERLSTMDSWIERVPFSELFDSWKATAVSDGDVLALDLVPAKGRTLNLWSAMLFHSDVHFLAW